MKNITRIAQTLALVALPFTVAAQSSVDMLGINDTELRGTARFMSMAGAFTALGGDLSTLTQNPAGIGTYRGSDVGLTLDLSFLTNKSEGIRNTYSMSNTHFDVNNFGYVGTMNFGPNSTMQTFSWGVSYNRLKSFTRDYKGGGMPLETSMSNYIALMTDNVNPSDMNFNKETGYDPYQDSRINWISILGYSSLIINPSEVIDEKTGAVTGYVYDGLFQYPVHNSSGELLIAPTTGLAAFDVRERGYTDEYNIDFGGNVANVVNWGIGFGITDMTHEMQTSYEERLVGANVAGANDGDPIREGDCDWQIDNWKRTTGTGFNLKLGVIIKPIQEFRIGLAVHTPTWYSLTTTYQGSVRYGDSYGAKADEYTNTARYDWNMRSPWRLMAGVAAVIGGRGIISADYEYTAFNKMHSSNIDGSFNNYNDCVASDFRATNTLRLGAEFRVTPQFSLRLGYSYVSGNVKKDVEDNNYEIYTSGTYLGYTFNQSSNYITAGLGYRTGGFYADLAYVNRQRTSTYHCFTPFKDYDGYWTLAPQSKIKESANQLALTVGYKF